MSQDVPQSLEDVWCQVRLLGPVDVLIDGSSVDGLTPLLLELLLFLATHRDSSTYERIQDAVWPGITPRLARQRARKALERLRTVLGDGPDGEPLVPHRTRDGDGRITLSRHVATDLDLALGRLEHARRATTNEEQLDHTLRALDHVRGEPFHTLPLSWSTDVTQRTIIDLQDAARRTADRAVELDRHDDAVRLLRQALLLLPGTEMLYLALATVEADRGRQEVVGQLLREFETTLDDDSGASSSDAWRELTSVGLPIGH